MRQRYRFRPSGGERLEHRQVLSSAALIAPVTGHPLTVTPATKLSLNDRVATAVNQAFDSFQSDYLQAQGTYLAQANPDTFAQFSNYITQRVQLLASDLIRALTQLPGSLNALPNGSGNVGPNGGGIVLQSFLRHHIINVVHPAKSLNTTLYTALLNNLKSTGSITTSPQFIALFTLNATTSIATAQTTTLNSIRFLIHNTFQNGHA